MEAVAFPPPPFGATALGMEQLPPYARVALSERCDEGAGFALTGERRASVDAAEEARQHGYGNSDCAHLYDKPRPPPHTRSLRCAGRSSGCGGGAAASPLVVYAFLVVISVIAIAWNARMALRNALEAQQLLREMAAGCTGAPGGRGGGLSRVASVADGTVGLADGVCMISAAELLQEALQVGQETVSRTASGSRKRSSSYAKVSQLNVLKGEARTLAHLGSAYYPSPEPELSYPHVDRWIEDARFGSVVTGSMSYAGGGITIGQSGLYFVYSQVGYVLAAKDVDEASSSTDHKLMRRQVASRGGLGGSQSDVLARAQKTRCWSNKSNCSMASSYVGAVFQLDEGDVVTVDVDRARYVWYSPQQTFIGAFLLSS